MVPLGLFHISFKSYSSMRAALGVIFEKEYKEEFDRLGIEYFYTLIDDAVARVVKFSKVVISARSFVIFPDSMVFLEASSSLSAKLIRGDHAESDASGRHFLLYLPDLKLRD